MFLFHICTYIISYIHTYVVCLHRGLTLRGLKVSLHRAVPQLTTCIQYTYLYVRIKDSPQQTHCVHTYVRTYVHTYVCMPVDTEVHVNSYMSQHIMNMYACRH